MTSTKPLVLKDGTIVRGLRVRFEGGRAVEVDADENAGALRAQRRDRRGRRAARRGRARRPRGQDRAARHRLLRHAARRERGQPHRARQRLRRSPSRRRTRPRQHERHARRLHGRLATSSRSPASPPAGERVPVLRGGDWQIWTLVSRLRAGSRRLAACPNRDETQHRRLAARDSSRQSRCTGTRRPRCSTRTHSAVTRACSPRAGRSSSTRRAHGPVAERQVRRRRAGLGGPHLVGRGQPAPRRGAVRGAPRRRSPHTSAAASSTSSTRSPAPTPRTASPPGS